MASPDEAAYAFASSRPELTWLHRAPSAEAAHANNVTTWSGLEVALYSRLIVSAP